MKTKTTFSKILAWGLTFALVLTMIHAAPFTLTASATTYTWGTTIPPTGLADGDVVTLGNGARGTLDVPENATVTIVGDTNGNPVIGTSGGISFQIPATSKVVWKAYFEVNSGTAINIQGGGGTFEITGGLVKSPDSVISANFGLYKVIVLGGEVQATTQGQGTAIRYSDTNAVVFIDDTKATVGNLNALSSATNAIAIRRTGNATTYTQGTSDDLAVTGGNGVDAKAKWDIVDDKYGISYERNTNKGFIEVPEVTVTVPIYEVTFDSNYTGGPSSGPRQVEDGKPLGEGFSDPLPTPTRTGYNFIGWFDIAAATGGEEYTAESIITESVTLYARWQPIVYYITYVLNDGTNHASNPATYTVEDTHIALQPPTRTGYTFLGWTWDAITTPNPTVTIYAGNNTFTAHWKIITYALTLDYNHGGKTETIPDITPGTSVTLPSPKRSEYKFDGWSETQTGPALTGPLFEVTKNATLYAQWTADPGNYYTPSEYDFVPIMVITGVNTEPFTAGTSRTLSGTVYPDNATNKTITWSLSWDLTAPSATVDRDSGVLTATGAGAVTVRATIANGKSATEDYTQDFTITVNPPATATVTFNYNYSGSPANITFTLNTGNAIGGGFPANPTRTGYTFAGWFSVPAATGGSPFTSTSIVSQSMTVYARWIPVGVPPSTNPDPDPDTGGDSGSGSGGSSGGSGSGSYIPTQPSTPDPTPNTIPGSAVGTDATTNIPVTVNNNTGSVRVNLDTATTEALIEKAISAVGRGTPDAPSPVPTVTLDLSSVESAKIAVLGTEAAKVLAEAGVEMAVKLPDAEITLNLDALGAIASAGAGSFTVEAAVVPMRDLRGMQAAQVKGYETVVSIDVFVGNAKVDVPLTVSLPYTLKPNENPAAVRVWYMDGNGTLTDLNGVYNRTTGMITFTISHQSYFVVGYDPVALWVNIFSDISKNDWYYDMVAYAGYHKLFEGNDGKFMPTDGMTRGMFATVLWKLEGKPVISGATSFPDVMAGTYYYDAVMWAAANGIVQGDNGRFDPDRVITRQEMALLLMNYASYKGYKLPQNRSMPSFTDRARIDAWAETAARALTEAGVMNGSNNEFMPLKDASRAEVAGLFRNFIRFVIGDR